MKETKVYMSELPKNCRECKFHSMFSCVLYDHDRVTQDIIEKTKSPYCPLQSIKTHDRELVKEVLEKVKNEAYKDGFYDENGEKIITYHISNYILDQIQKEIEK